MESLREDVFPVILLGRRAPRMPARGLCPVYSDVLGGSEDVWCERGRIGETGGRAAVGLESPPIYQSVEYHRAPVPVVDRTEWLFCSSRVNSCRGKLSLLVVIIKAKATAHIYGEPAPCQVPR